MNESDSKLERRIKVEVAKRLTASCSSFYQKIVQGDNPFKIKVRKKGLLGDLLNEALNSTSQMKQAKQEFEAMRRWLLSLR